MFEIISAVGAVFIAVYAFVSCVKIYKTAPRDEETSRAICSIIGCAMLFIIVTSVAIR